MPTYRRGGYRRNYRRKRTYRYRKSGFKRYRAPDSFDYARNAWQAVKKIKRMINTEVKHHDVIQATENNITSAGTLDYLASIPAGDGNTEREGISIKPLNLTIRFQLRKETAGASGNTVRIGVCRGKQENATGLVFDDIYELAGTLQPKTYDKRFKTKILKEKSYSMDENSTSKTIFVTWVIPLMGHVNYDVSSNFPENGGIYLYYFSNVAATNFPKISYHARLTFTDN